MRTTPRSVDRRPPLAHRPPQPASGRSGALAARSRWAFAAALLLVLSLGLAAAAPAAVARTQSDRESALEQHGRAVEEAFRFELDELVRRFESERFSAGYLERTTPEARRELLARIREAAAAAGDIGVDLRGERLIVELANDEQRVEVELAVEDDPPWRLADLAVQTVATDGAGPGITRDDLAATFERLEDDGLSGVVHVRLDGEVVLERAFGTANRELGVPVSLDTVFGTGSRPIDYTKAAIYLLEQEGALDQDDPITEHFEDVPEDKRGITLRHLMTGRSGLVDFFHTDEDWNADLAWIDRETAERRLLRSELLFEPGSQRRHSHAAFGLLAAVIERVSGKTYEAFLRERFFEPAGMTRTGFYGDARGLVLEDFAVGGGPERVGLPNIPPNWGPTSWLVMGSGGTWSTLPDLQRFYALVRSDEVLKGRYSAAFRGASATLDGSDRGFELLHVHEPPGNELYLMVNASIQDQEVRELFRALERLVTAP